MTKTRKKHITRTLSASLAALLLTAALVSCSPRTVTEHDAVPAPSPAEDDAAPETVPEEDAPLTSDTAAFADSTAFFNLRTDRKKADADEVGLTLSWDGVALPRAGRLYYLPVEADFEAADLLKLSAEGRL